MESKGRIPLELKVAVEALLEELAAPRNAYSEGDHSVLDAYPGVEDAADEVIRVMKELAR